MHVQNDGGSYISWFSGEMFSGGEVYDRNYSLYEIPLFVQAGSIIPMKIDDFGNNSSVVVLCMYVCMYVYCTCRTIGISSSYSNCNQIGGICRRCVLVSLSLLHLDESITNIILASHTHSGTGELYEDDGKTTQYMNGRYANTTFSFVNM